MRLLVLAIRGMAIAALIVAAPSMLRAADEGLVCHAVPDWYGWDCISCAYYGEGCTEWKIHSWFCVHPSGETHMGDRIQPGACSET
jgi:hypothetical protein